MKRILILFLFSGIVWSCKKDETKDPEPEATTQSNCPASSCINPDTAWVDNTTGPKLIFKFKFDSTQARLNNLGQPSSVGSGNAAYSPIFNKMSAHYIELAPGDLTPLGGGKVLYRAAETTCAGNNAITFCQSVVVKENVAFYSIPLSELTPGTYKWLRLSLAYQNYDIKYKNTSLPTPGNIGTGTIASFLGFNTYVSQYTIKTQTMTPSAGVKNYKQGYWGFETNVLGYIYKADGEAPANSTTVVNPNPLSPIPAGSCVVTAEFADNTGATNQVLTITGTETQDIVITVSLSTNKSFEWHEVNADGHYEPSAGESPVDMGIRGMIPKVQY